MPFYLIYFYFSFRILRNFKKAMNFLNFLKNKFKKKFIFLFLFLVISYGYFLFLIGGLWGYFSAKFLAGKKEGEQPKIFKSLIIKIKNWRIHLHHWLYSTLLLILGVILKLPIIHNELFLGFLLGVIYQGINCYQDWKLIIKK